MNDAFNKVKGTMILIASIFLILGTTTFAHAITINGIVTDSTGTVTDGSIGVSVGGGKYEYFIPLSGSEGIYGVSDSGSYGESSDSATSPFTAPIMDMYFNFNIASGQKGKSISLWTDDLDLGPSNDPDHFFERIFIHNSIITGGHADIPYENYNTLGGFSNVVLEPASVDNQNAVKMTFNDLNIESGSYLLHLGFQVYNDEFFTLCKRWPCTNTAEHISATMETAPVPEPGTLILMGSGLVGMLFLGKRIKKTATRI